MRNYVMGVYGRLATMSLGDLVRWLGETCRTGCLQIERDRVSTAIFFREGRIVACSSDDPQKLLGQFLAFQGQIDDATLREAMSEQARSGEMLGRILVNRGALDEEALEASIASKAEETMLGLFEHEDGTFWYEDGLAPGRSAMKTDLGGAELLAHGKKRHDDIRRLRATFPDLGMVPCRTAVSPDSAWLADPSARRVYAMVDGERPIQKILFLSHGTEFLVLRQIAGLCEAGLVEIDERPSWADMEGDDGGGETAFGHAMPAAGAAPLPSETVKSCDQPPIEPRIDEARKLIERGKHEGALEILGAAYRQDPENQSVRQLLNQAETTFLEDIEKAGIPYTKIPVLVTARESAAGGGMSPAERLLLDMIDGSWDVRSLTWIAPMRSVEVLRALNRLIEKGMVRLEDAVAAGDPA